MALSLRDTIEVAPDVEFRELDGEAVVLNLDSGTYFGLDPVGTRIWELVRQCGSLQTVFEAISDEYDVEPETLERDLL